MTLIDLHTHLAPALAAGALGGGVERGEDGWLVVDGHRVGLPALYDPERLLAHLDATATERAAVCIPPPFYRQGLDEEACAGWVAVANDGIVAASGRSSRLLALAYLPLEHPQVALAEYERVRGGPWAGVTASAGGGSTGLADPSLERLWAALDRDGRLLLLHPGTSPDRRLDEFYLANLLGNPVETALATAQLVFGDVLARFAGMRVLLAHCGGAVPALVGRWQRGVETDRPGLRALTEPPAVAVRRLFVDCLAHNPAVVDLAVATFGSDRIVLGSDWPFPMGHEDPAALLRHRGEAYVEQAGGANALAALGSAI